MARQKTKRTAVKRMSISKPKDSSKAKVLVNPAGTHHLRAKKNASTKRRQIRNKGLIPAISDKFKKIATNA